MSNADVNKYFEYHNQNMNLLRIGFDRIKQEIIAVYKSKSGEDYLFELPVNDPRRQEAQDKINSYNRILSGIQISWAEESIKRLWYESSIFTSAQRDFLLGIKALEQKWHLTLKLSLCIAYNLAQPGDEACQSVNVNRDARHLGGRVLTKYRYLKALIRDIVVPGIHIRNKVQHGEWVAAFSPPSSIVYNQRLSDKIAEEDVVRINSRYIVTTSLYNLIVEIARFKSGNFALDSTQTPFEYFFDQRKRKIEFEKKKVLTSGLEGYVLELIEAKKRGESYRTAPSSER